VTDGQDFFSLAGLDDPFLGSLILSCVVPYLILKPFLTSFSCVNLLAVLLWSLTTDKLGRRTILLPCQTLLVVILFVVGGLHFSGATATDPTLANAAAGTALVNINRGS
jgi:SP family general alpha glucoside:H+ symporter-like MFS transporter